MQYFTNIFDPRDYNSVADLGGNADVTLMIHSKTGKSIVRKAVGAAGKDIYTALTNISNDNLVQVLGMEEVGSDFFMYEEYINGNTLAEVLKGGPVSEDVAYRWIQQLCNAVKTLHEFDPPLIHRDIKPGNIILSSDGVIKLIDFDATKKFTSQKKRDTELIGTPDYAAPEQYGFAPSSPQTDIYAIGILFHELVTGHKPNEGSIVYKGRYKHVIRRCTELDPKMRYKNIHGLERQLGMHGIRQVIWNIPGFRTGAWWKSLIATISYIIAIIFVISTVWYEQNPAILLWNTFLLAPPYILLTNPLRIRDKLPLLDSRRLALKLLGAALYILAWLTLLTLTAEFFYNTP